MCCWCLLPWFLYISFITQGSQDSDIARPWAEAHISVLLSHSYSHILIPESIPSQFKLPCLWQPFLMVTIWETCTQAFSVTIWASAYRGPSLSLVQSCPSAHLPAAHCCFSHTAFREVDYSSRAKTLSAAFISPSCLRSSTADLSLSTGILFSLK